MSHGVLDVRRHRRPTRSASTPYAPVSAYDDEEPRLAPPAKPSSPEPSLRVTTQSWNTSTPRGTVSDRQRRGRMRTDTSRHVFRMVGADSPASSMHAPEPEASVPFKALGSAAPPVPSPPAAVDANEADDMDERLQQELDALWMNEENERHKAYARLATPDRRSHRSVGARSARRRRTRRAMARSTSMGALAARPEPEASEQPGGGTSDSEEDFQDAATARTLRTDAQAQLRAELLSQQREIEERKRRLLQEQREAMRLAELEQQRLAELERKAAELEHQRLAERQQQERIAREAERQQRELERLEQARRLAVEQERMREAERLESERVRLEQRMREAAEREAAAKRAQQQALAAEAEREKRRLDGQLAAEARRVQKEKERAEAARAAAAERERARREAEEKAEQARRAAIAREEQARQAALEQAEREQARLAALEQAARERERLAALEAERERRAAEEREKQEQARLAALEQAARERERLAALEAERERRAAEERAEQEKARLAALEQEARERERLAALEAERERRAADERAEQARLASLARAEREQRIADEQAEHARRKEAAVAAQRAREAEAQAAEQRARAAAEAERAREEREAHAEETQHTAVQQEAEREALCRAYAAREAREAERLQLEGRALRRAWREADDEDRMIRTQARRTEDSDDAASATETEHSGTSDATDASRLTHMLGRLRIVSRQGAPGTTGILTSAPSAPQQRLRFTVPAPARDESVRAHPALPWLSHIMEVHVPRTVAPPSASASNLAAVDVAVHAVGAVAHRLRASMLSMHSLDSAMPDEAWAVRPVGAYRNGGVRYLPGFTVHGLAEAPRPPQAVRGELLLTAMPLAFVQQLLMHLDFGDIRALYDVSASVRKVLQQPEVHETVLRRFLGPFGYVSGASGDTGAVALPLSLLDVEGFLMYVYGGDELYPAAHIYLTSAHQLDRRLPRLARAMVRSYNRVLAHVRLQAPSASSGAWEVQGPDGVHAVQVSSLVTPGLVSMFQAWAPAWPSGAPWVASQVQRVERELFVSGVWRLLRKGDMALNMATDERFVFDGYALVPLATEFDAQGHLPACINALRYAPTYFDPVLPPTATPAMYMNVSPWRDEIVTSLQLVRDNIERTGANRQLYRISKWVYRAAFTVSVPAEDTPDFIASAFEAHAGWNGTVVIDVESTAEHVARFLERCRCPGDPASWVTDVLAHVLESTNSMLDVPRPTSEEHGAQTLHPFYLLRERSGAGVAWLVPA